MDTRDNHRFGIEALRTVSSALDQLSETFLQRYTVLQLLRIWEAWCAAPWDIYPDQWTESQVQEAIRDDNPLAPNWDESQADLGGDGWRYYSDIATAGVPFTRKFS